MTAAWRWFRALPLWAQIVGWLLGWWLLIIALLWRAPLSPRWRWGLSGGWLIVVLALVAGAAGSGSDDAPAAVAPLVATVTSSATLAAPTATATPTRTPSPTRTPTPTASPTPTRTATPARTATPSPAATVRTVTEASAPCLDGQVKANRNSGIYHQPGQRDYERTTANVACFDTAAQAEAAGYRPAQR